jgi:hypothetical protein
MGNAFLGADKAHNFRVRIKDHPETALVPVGNGLAEAAQTDVRRVLMVGGFCGPRRSGRR